MDQAYPSYYTLSKPSPDGHETDSLITSIPINSTMMKQDIETASGLLKLNYSKPNYEQVKSDMNHKDYKRNHQVISFEEMKKFDDLNCCISTSQKAKNENQWIKPSTLTKKADVKTVDNNGEENISEIFYDVTFSRTHYEEEEDGTVRSSTHFWVDEFYYALIPCASHSGICQGLVQERIYTDDNRQKDRCEQNLCSACAGTLFHNEKVVYVKSSKTAKKAKTQPSEMYVLEKSDQWDWYQKSKPIPIISWGGGKDSSAMILKYGYEAQEIIMCDTGAEEIETYEYIKYFIQKLPREIRNKITIIENDREGKIDEWYMTKKLQPMPFADRQCTDKWKLRVIHRYVKKTYGTKAVFNMMVGINYDEQIARERPLPTEIQLDSFIESVKYTKEDIIRLANRQKITVEDYREKLKTAIQTGARICYSCPNEHKGKDGLEKPFCEKCKIEVSEDTVHIEGGCQYARNVYPLCVEKIGLDQELEIFKEHGLEVPPKSGCYFCPMKGKKEWKELEEINDGRFENTVRIQEHSNARLKIMNMSTEKKDDMRCSCSNGLYDAEDEDKPEKYVTIKAGRGM